LSTFCISHVKDVDGLGAAALVVAATGGQFLLSDYDSLINDLGRIPDDASDLVVCDLGTDDSTRDEMVRRLATFAKRGTVTYIDHHYLPSQEKRKLVRQGVTVFHDVRECASMLTYKVFKKTLPDSARLIALFGAVTDYMDTSPLGRRMMEKMDRHFVLAEAMLLSHAVARAGRGEGFPEMIVRELSTMKLPHEMDRVPSLALEQLKRETELSKELRRTGKKFGNLAYAETTETSTGNVAKLLIGAFDVPLGVSIKPNPEKAGWSEVSLRSTSETKLHLGRAIGKIAIGLGGSGGGHRKAAGCQIPTSKVPFMLRELRRSL
jgi:hypothetical protein